MSRRGPGDSMAKSLCKNAQSFMTYLLKYSLLRGHAEVRGGASASPALLLEPDDWQECGAVREVGSWRSI